LSAQAERRLIAAARDADRRVRTEAVRALGTYSDSAAIRVLVDALSSVDSWISISAAEGLGRIRAPSTIAALTAAASPGHACALRVTAMQSLQPFSPSDALVAARALTRDSVAYCRTIGWQAVVRDTSRSVAERRADLSATDTIQRVAALRAMATWADTTELPMLLDVYDGARNAPNPVVASAVIAAIGGLQNRRGVGATQFLTRFAAPPSQNATLRRDANRAFGAAARAAWGADAPTPRSIDEYRAIVERWVVPAYAGKPNPKAQWETPRGQIELELYAGDAPLAVDYFVRTIESGTVVGTEFTRVVPDFVDQQATIRNGHVLRDEVNRHRLTRANLAWATSGLDTGSPGYTLNHTPQPHNEGDFTSMGRVTRGMNAVDRIELGDRVTAARMVPDR
jgi:peptidyl-prolyl cis-trans isomerase B (cyclophilin B)